MKVEHIELLKFVLAVRVSHCLIISVVDVLSRLLRFARDVVSQMRDFFHAYQRFCRRLASLLQLRTQAQSMVTGSGQTLRGKTLATVQRERLSALVMDAQPCNGRTGDFGWGARWRVAHRRFEKCH